MGSGKAGWGLGKLGGAWESWVGPGKAGRGLGKLGGAWGSWVGPGEEATDHTCTHIHCKVNTPYE